MGNVVRQATIWFLNTQKRQIEELELNVLVAAESKIKEKYQEFIEVDHIRQGIQF